MTSVKLTRWERLKLWWHRFHVVCDDRNNTEQDVAEGRVNANIFIVPIFPKSKQMPGVLSDYLGKPSPLREADD